MFDICSGETMADQSTIEWTDATWNPVTGCTKISPGCDNCYAERFSERFRGVNDHPFETGFDLTLRPQRLEHPLSWKRPRMIFVNSMSDLFHKEIPIAFIDRVFDVMERADWHIFQVLTKRSSLMRRYINRRYTDAPSPKHIWLGVSVEDAARASRIRHLQETNAAIRFLSVEPMIGPIGRVNLQGIHWVIAGGESGPKTRQQLLEFCKSTRTIHTSPTRRSSSRLPKEPIFILCMRRVTGGGWKNSGTLKRMRWKFRSEFVSTYSRMFALNVQA
jgi:protein gp37